MAAAAHGTMLMTARVRCRREAMTQSRRAGVKAAAGAWLQARGLQGFVFQKARACGFVAWHALLAADARLGLRGKVLVVKQRMPHDTAGLLVAAGAEAVIMPTAAMPNSPDSARCNVLAALYRRLAQGRSPALAVAEANAACGEQLLACIL